jgi:hypothetical protein
MNPEKISMDQSAYRAVKSYVKNVEFDGDVVLNVNKDPKVIEVDEPTYARLDGSDFHDGIIEVKVLSRLLPDAPDYSRGFIGLAFRINDDDSKFEGIYIRPTNGRNENQNRRNNSTQYFSYPDYKFDLFRKINPGKYESYADMGLDEWIDFKIVVEGEHAKLFLNDSVQPVLVVNDMKHGPDARGALGLWVDIGTDGYFKDLKITKFD